MEEKTNRPCVEYLEGLLKPQQGKLFVGLSLYLGEGVTSFTKSSDLYVAAILSDTAFTFVPREGDYTEALEIPYDTIVSLSFERSAETTAWPLRVHRKGKLNSLVHSGLFGREARPTPENWFYIEYGAGRTPGRVLLHLDKAIAGRFRASARKLSGLQIENITAN